MNEQLQKEVLCALQEAYSIAVEWLPDSLPVEEMTGLHKTMDRIKATIDKATK